MFLVHQIYHLILFTELVLVCKYKLNIIVWYSSCQPNIICIQFAHNSYTHTQCHIVTDFLENLQCAIYREINFTSATNVACATFTMIIALNYTLYICSTCKYKSWQLTISLKITAGWVAISRTIEQILGLLIWMHFSRWIQIWQM